MATLAAAHAAAAKLKADDKYGVPLRAWLADIEALAEGECPRHPPWLDERRLGKASSSCCSSSVPCRPPAPWIRRPATWPTPSEAPR